MHRLPGCYKSFYNKLHKALWCLNIYGCLRFPLRVALCQSSNSTKSCGATPDVLSGSRGKGPGGLDLHQRRNTQGGRTSNESFSIHHFSSPTSSVSPLNWPSKQTYRCVTSGDQTDKQTNILVRVKTAKLGLWRGPRCTRCRTNMLEISMDARRRRTRQAVTLPGGSLTDGSGGQAVLLLSYMPSACGYETAGE